MWPVLLPGASGPLWPAGKPQTHREPFHRPCPPGHGSPLRSSLQQPWSLFSYRTRGHTVERLGLEPPLSRDVLDHTAQDSCLSSLLVLPQ